MQLLHNHQTLVASVQDLNMMSSLSAKDAATGNYEVKENRSSDGSLLLMNPVASGDNVTTGLSSAHKLKEELPTNLPPLIPCCEGRELQINEDLVRTGLSKISVKHDTSVIQSLSMSQACERMQVSPGLIKHRNSFRSLHRPDLKGVPYLRRLTPDDLETLFRGDKIVAASTCLGDDCVGVSSDTGPGEKLCEKQDEKGSVTTAENGNRGGSLHPILEARSGLPSDVPIGMRLHGARARLYTSVLAGSRAGDQLDGPQSDDFDARVPDEVAVTEDEVQSSEELQIILPPPQVTGQSTSSTTANSVSAAS